MKVKVCGMKHPDNIENLSLLPVDYMGFIFYPKSLRYVGELSPKLIHSSTTHMMKVGVFVNENQENLFNIVEKYDLNAIQLHGNETQMYCKNIVKNFPKINVIKAFSILGVNDLNLTKEYEEFCDFFLFDTKSQQYGGTGKKFDWSILNSYKGEKRFFLSGGISIEDVEKIKEIQHPKLYGLDINSNFEIEPGRKDIELVKQFIQQIKL
ncbi:phosphoribosylanthranilate isomerase [Apibacter sp.]|uniref:phosphoribosylanthranilate isomerase n=1 Tax=Apibacter sp. TaxID=2023709 RepID=UPI0025DC41B6|nr:phosphoribosylanthranilate isomerase [Apibacter sp.]MCT6868586.1 phosphoribosylanthranilate isomerase [Apibacter sp.]